MASSRVDCKHPTCKRSFKSHDSMKQHFSDSHTSSQAKEEDGCAWELCNKTFRKQGSFQAPMRSLHLTQAPNHSPAAGLPSRHQRGLLETLACGDHCGKAKFKTADALRQHQLIASASHIRVTKSPLHFPSQCSWAPACSQCGIKLPTAKDLKQHFAEHHPISEMLRSSEEETWQQVEARFQPTWTKPTTNLYKLHHIFKLYNTGWRRADYEQIQKKIKPAVSNQKLLNDDNLELRNKTLEDANELLCYHHTTMQCRCGHPPSSKDKSVEELSLCINKACCVCQTLLIGFNKSICRVKKFQRFGKDVYCFVASSKASSYVKSGKWAQRMSKCFKWFSTCFDGDASINPKGSF